MKLGELSLETQELLGKLREAAHSDEEKERFLVAMDALKFIGATGQSQDFNDYRQSLDTHAPPLVIAAFDTREEAEAWLNGHPKPPHLAYILIAGAYHVVMHVPELHHRRLISHPVLEFYLADMIREGIPAPFATFNTREEAKAWVDHQPDPPRQVFIHIGGQPHLVAYHHRIGLRAMYPLSMAAPLKQADE